MVNYQHIIKELNIVMGTAGIFDIEVNDKMIFSKEKMDRFPEPGEVLSLFEELLPEGSKRYGD